MKRAEKSLATFASNASFARTLGQAFNAAPGSPKPGRAASPSCAILNKDDKDKPVEVLIYDDIGKSEWTGAGFDAKDFVNELKGVDENRELHVRLNSRGGVVDDGIAIYNRLKEWPGKTVAIIDGSAASIASVIAMGAKEVRMPKSAEILIHEAHGLAFGTASDMEEMSARLEGASNRIAGIYARKTGKSVETMRDYMRKTTVFDGEKAKEIGLADALTDQEPIYNLSKEDIENFRLPPGKPPVKPPAKKGENTMNKAQIIAAIQKLGGTVAENATDDQLIAQLESLIEAKAKATDKKEPETKQDATLLALQESVKLLREQNEKEKKNRISAEIDGFITNDQLPAANREKYIVRAMADESVLEEYRAMPSRPPGVEPLSNMLVVGEDPKQLEKAILRNFGGNVILTPEQSRERGRVRASIITQNWDRLMPVMNTNTVSSDLKRTVILQQMIRAFAIKVLPLSAFSTVFNGIRLEGTDKVAVPYFPLITTASTAFNASNGYDTFVNSNSDAKTVTVDKRQYIGLTWTSSELARQPFMDMGMAAMLTADQLGLDVVNDVLSIILLATYTNTAYAQAAAAFDSDDVMELKGRADTANWPAAGRSLVLNSAYDVNLLKDGAVKNAMAFGDNSPIREGRILRIGGFDYYPDARVPANAQDLQGFIVFKSAMLVAFSPVNPTAEVRQQLTRYEVVTEPVTGAQFEYRMWGDATKDTTKEIVESNYGKIAGEVTALTRITA